MIKTLKNLLKQDKESYVVSKGVQDAIPITAIYDDGIFRSGKDKYSKTFLFTDINYAVASREDKEGMFLEYSELLNSLDSGATTKITINNRRLNRLDFEKSILIPLVGDELDQYREEYNKMLLDKATGANSIVQDKYMTISVNKKSVEDARTYFARVGADLIAHFGRLGSKCTELETDERLRIFHDFYRVGEETAFHFDINETRKKGHDFKDYICPDTLEFENDYFKMGNRYGRVLFLREYASYIKDSMVAELTDMNRNLMMSIDVVPVPTDEAVREAENRLLGVETNITNWQRKQNQNNNFSATIPYDMEQQKKEMKDFLDDLTTRDQRMMFAVLTMVHTADSKDQLDNDTEALLTTARKHLCQFAVLKYQQMDGLNTVMPFGTRKIDCFRTLTTESLAVFIPFRVQDIYHENGIYYGQNVISKNMIIADRKQLLNGNEFVLGVSGGGKSFAAKGEIINQVLSSDADIIIIDPEREYSKLVTAMGGETIKISATSQNHINAMDMNKDYGDGANPVILKSEFIMSLCEQLMMTVNEVSKLTGVSIRTLQYYDKIGLLNPAKYTESGYRLYDNANLQKLQQILLFRELEFSLKEIGFIIASPDFDRSKALEQQIQLLTLKKEHLENLITFARGIRLGGEDNMNFSPFDTTKIDEYAKEAKAKWGNTAAFKEFSDKSKGRSKEADNAIANGLMTIFADFGKIKDENPASSKAQSLVKKLQSYITENYYTCTPQILNSLGLMYSAGGDFTDNIDAAGGVGTAQFATQAISIYCK